jgi:integrase
VREVHLSPELADLFMRYQDRRRPHADRRSVADEFLWAAADGRPRRHTWALNKVHRAGRVATDLRTGPDLPPLPNVTPHILRHTTPRTLRHTYISILLLVTDNVPYVMEEVGHEDQDTTNRIYRQLIRQRRQHGSAFDRVLAEAHEAFGTAAGGGRFVG